MKIIFWHVKVVAKNNSVKLGIEFRYEPGSLQHMTWLSSNPMLADYLL